MLKQLRSRKLMKRVMQITLILVIPSFVAFYGWNAAQRGSGGGPAGEWWARYRGDRWFGLRWTEISSQFELKAAKESVQQQAAETLRVEGRLSYDQKANEKLIRDLSESPHKIATEAINLRLEDAEAGRLKMTVPERELQDMVAEIIAQIRRQSPEATARLSNAEIWQRYLRLGVGQREEDFIADQTRAIRRHKVKNMRMDEALPSLSDLWREYLVEGEKIDAMWVNFRVSDFLDGVQPTTDALRAHFEGHLKEYAYPDQREYAYVMLRRNGLYRDVTITSDARRLYYDTHHDAFTEPAEVKPRLIFVETQAEDNAGTEAIRTYLDRIDTVDNLVKAPGADFAALADKYSDDPRNLGPGKTKLGGLLDDFISEKKRSRYGREFDRAALALSEGQTTGPVHTDMGAYFIRAEKVDPPRLLPFDEVENDVEQILTEQEADKRFGELRDRFKEQNERQTTLEALARVMNAEIGPKAVVAKDATEIPGVGDLQDEKESLASLSLADPKTGVITTRDFHVVLQLIEEIPAHDATFEEVAERVRRDVSLLQASEAAKKKAEAFTEKARQPGADFAALARTEREDRFTSGVFSPSRPVLGNIENFDVVAQDVTTGTLRVDETVSMASAKTGSSTPTGYVVWKVRGVSYPSREEFFKTAGAYMFVAAEYDRLAIFNEWLADQRRKVSFELNEF